MRPRHFIVWAGFLLALPAIAYSQSTTGATASCASRFPYGPEQFVAPPSEDRPGWTRVMRQTVEGLTETAYPYIERYKAALANKHFILRWENGVTVPLDASFEAYVYVIIEGLRQLLTR